MKTPPKGGKSKWGGIDRIHGSQRNQTKGGKEKTHFTRNCTFPTKKIGTSTPHRLFPSASAERTAKFSHAVHFSKRYVTAPGFAKGLKIARIRGIIKKKLDKK